MLSSQESLAEKFVKKGFWLYFLTFFIAPLGYIVKVIISRDLSVEEVGMLYGVISFVVFLSMYNDLGCTESMGYFLPKLIVEKEYGKVKYLLRMIIIAQMSTSLFIYILIYFFSSFLSTHYFKSDVTEILQIAGLFFIGINILHIATTFFVATQDTKLQKLSELIRLLGTTIGVLFLFFSDTGNIRSYMIMWIFGLIVGIIFAIYHVGKKYYIPYLYKVPLKTDISLRKTFFRYSLATLFTANIGMLLSQIDMQLIIYMLQPKDVGYYSTYLSLIAIPFMLITPIIGFLFPVISELSGRKEGYKIQALVEKFWNYVGILGIWISISLFQFGEIISVLLFGEKFRESGQILAFSALFIILNLLIQVAFQVLAGTGQIRKRIRILFITLCINIPLNILLIPLLGTKGSALAVGLSWIPLYYMSTRAMELKINLFGNIHWGINLLGGMFAFFLSYYLINYSGMTDYYLNIIIAILLYLIIFLLINKNMLLEAFSVIKNVRSKKVHNPPSSDISLPISP